MRRSIRSLALSLSLALFFGSTSATAALIKPGSTAGVTIEVAGPDQAALSKRAAKLAKRAKKAEKQAKQAAKKARKKAAKRAARRARKAAEEAANPVAEVVPVKPAPVEKEPLPPIEFVEEFPGKTDPKPEPIEEKQPEPVVVKSPKPALNCDKPGKRKGLRRRWRAEKSFKFAFHRGRDPRRLVLKLRDDACATAAKGRLFVGDDRGLSDVVKALESSAPGAHVTRRFQANDKTLEAARREGESNIGQRLADMRQYYWILLDHEDHMKPLLSELVRLDAVENVYSPSLPVAPPGDILEPPTPNFSGNLGFWNSAPDGLDIDFAANVVGASKGGTGGAATVADLEYGWNFDHEDLSGSGPSALYELGAAGAGFSPFGNDHGTAVAGIIAADSDAPGIKGIAPSAGYLAVPVMEDALSAVDTAQAILDVAVTDPTRRLGARGVVLLEMQASGPNAGAGQFGLVPVEYEQAEFDAIKLATSLGVVVIEAAANGSQDLDLRSGNSGHPTYDVFDPSVRHSGAILVGGGTSSAPHTPNQTSNVGGRIDAYAWGQNVFSLGYGPLRADGFPAGNADPNQLYVSNFGGTSGASAIIAGVTAIFESVHFVNHQSQSAVRHLDSTALRLLLRTTGTASDDPAVDRIGRQPDLAEQLPLMSMGPNLGSVFSGEADAGMGAALAPIDDLDGDGVGELIVGSPGGSGSVTIYSGASGDIIVRFPGNPGERFGAAVSAIEDLDGDGLQDVIVGAPDAFGSGRVTIHSTGSFQILRNYLGENSGDDYGAAVASQGDADGDGVPEIVVGAPLFDRFGQDGGRVYNISTATNQTRWTKDGASGANYGSVLVTGDVLFGDGALEILVGSPGDPGFANNAAGRVFVYQPTGDLWNVYTGMEDSAQFGSSIALVGDRDGDGRDDFAVGSPGENLGRGSVAIFSGHSTGLLQFTQGRVQGARFGQSLAGPGDIDNDGVSDVLVGAPFQGGSSGAVFAIGLGPGSMPVRARYSAEASGDRLGTSLAVVGDVNGDGQREFVAGAPGSGRAGNAGGAAYLFVLPRFGYQF